MDEIDDDIADKALFRFRWRKNETALEAMRAAIRVAVLAERERIADYIEGKGGVIPGANVFAPLVSGNRQPCMSGDGRDRMPPRMREIFDEATAELAAAIRARGNGGEND